MNKRELAVKIAKMSETTIAQSERFITAFEKAVIEEVAAGEKVQLPCFGSFKSIERSERPGRNPKNPDIEIIIPAKIVPKFTAGKYFKEEVNK